MSTDDPTAAPPDPMGPEPETQPDRQAMPVDAEQPPRLPFPVVGIGASAGGLEAFTEFIREMRPDSGMAFVFIQHLPPERESMVAEILSKKTHMLVQQVEDGMEVKPDHLYVIRPGHVLTIRDGHLHLGPQLGRKAANRPVDDFFRSLAEEQRERAIAVVMSGMGSNGAAGAQAVKAVGGLCVAQDPETAQYPSMPRHLIDQGYADYILAPRDIPEVLLQYAGHPYARENRGDAVEQAKRNDNHLREILAVLRTRTRTDFGGYKKPTLLRRIHRRMGLTRLTDMGDYARLMRQSPGEVRSLADDVLIHVTGFFRDREAWEALRQKVIAPLVARREPESEVRAWVTACSSGEEAYTLAMVLVEEAERANKPLGIKVFATDMAERPLAHARQGIYPGGIESELEAPRLERFFEKEDGVYRVRQHLREAVVFAPQNVLSDPPFSRLDIVSCRNLLIYLEPEVQQRVLNLLHFGLREGGALFLGSSETVAGADDLYELVDKRSRIFRRVGPTRHGQLDFPLPLAARGAGPDAIAASAELLRAADRRITTGRPSIAHLTHRTLLERHVKAAVTVDRDNRVIYFHGNTRAFLDQPPGEPTRDLFLMAREGLRGSIRVALHRSAAEMTAVTVVDGWLETTPGRRVRVAVIASPVSSEDPAQPEYFVVSFDELEIARGGPKPEGGNGDPAVADETELRRVRDELQTTIEELQTSNEELKASHEEVVSINEELQSANEELETSKEEMQSLNEELTTVNAQLQVKAEEHQSASNDLTALLTSTAIAVLFLDTSFRIRRHTPAVRELIDLIPSDVGRPLADLRRKFDDPNLDADVRVVLDKLVPVEREVMGLNGRHYARRALPYRTVDNRIDGVVVTFVDVTDRKRMEAEAAAARAYAEGIVETLHDPLLVLNGDLTVRSANAAFYRHFKVEPSETRGRKVYDLGNGQWNIPSLRKALEEVLPQHRAFDEYEVTHEFESLGRRVMLLNGRQVAHAQLILLGIRDVTDEHAGSPRKQLEDQLRRANEALEQRVGERTESIQIHQRQLRSLLAELGRAEIRQRRLLAAELHDSLAQLLAVCKMRASAIEAQATKDTPLRNEAGLVKDGLQEAITYTRGLMADLRPDVLDEHDLAAAIEWAAERMTRHGLKVEVVDDARPKPLDEEVLGFLFQAVRELLWNVVKHARVTEAVVRVERDDAVVRVTVEDRGRGFEPGKRAAPTEEGGYGLFSIAERIDLLGGKMEIESARRRGTRVTLTAPLEPGDSGGNRRQLSHG